jgi:hypothetical protein
MPMAQQKTDSVAFLFETENLNDHQIEQVKAFINRELSKQLSIASYSVQVKRFNTEWGGVTIYQP